MKRTSERDETMEEDETIAEQLFALAQYIYYTTPLARIWWDACAMRDRSVHAVTVRLFACIRWLVPPQLYSVWPPDDHDNDTEE